MTIHSTRPAGRIAGIGSGRAVTPPSRIPPPPPRTFAGRRTLQRVRGGLTLGDYPAITVANAATPAPGWGASSYTEWLAAVKAAGGVATALNNKTAARYPAATIAAHAGDWGTPDAWTRARDWGYYFAPAAPDRDAGNSVAATPIEIAEAAAKLESTWWAGPVKAIGLTIAGGLALNFILRKL